MAQFSVYQNKNNATQAQYPFLLNIQNDLLASMQTCVVVPMTALNKMAHPPIQHLTPVFVIEGEEYCMMTPQLAGIHRRELGDEVSNLHHHQHTIITAIDFLLSGV